MRTHGGSMSEGLENEKGVSLEQLQEQLKEYSATLDSLKSTNERLLHESKTNAEKYRKARDENQELSEFKKQKSEIERKQLEETENWKELLKMEQEEKERISKERTDYSSKAEKMASLMVDKDLKFQVGRFAPDARDIDDLIMQVKRESLTLDEENLTFNGVEEAIESIKQKKPWFFEEAKKTGMVSSLPKVGDVKPDSLNEMSKKQKEQLFKQALTELEGQAS